ncbi:MAG: tetratricopeptide repeat protein [Planctomycetaceae bacterium]|nr:tetratricopeptide repeat protein [Planctomycetaceae bacterium]
MKTQDSTTARRPGPIGSAARMALVLLALLHGATGPALGQSDEANKQAEASRALADESWVGRKVVLRGPDAQVKVDKRVVATGQVFRVYRVDRGVGDWLWVVADDVAGWAVKDRVVPVEQAWDESNRAIENDPNAAWAYSWRGALAAERRDWDRALADFDAAIRLGQADAATFGNRGLAWACKRQFAAAIADFDEVLRRDPNDARAYEDRADAWLALNDDERALADFDAAVRLQPGNARARCGRGVAKLRKQDPSALDDLDAAIRLDRRCALAYVHRAGVWASRNERDRALADFDEAIRLNPWLATARDHRGRFWIASGDPRRALVDFEEAVRLDPNQASAHRNRGVALCAVKSYSRALADFNEAIRLDPGDPEAYAGRAWLWATCPDQKFRDARRAVESATRACELGRWSCAHCLDVLAAAQAEAGDFVAAAESEARAMATARVGDPDRAAYLNRLSLYQGKKTYRDGPRRGPEEPIASAPARRPTGAR